jgi:cold shock CspA family protein
MADGAQPPGANGLPVAQGVVSSFDVGAGVGWISTDARAEEVCFGFTAIPGEGYRTLRPGTPVSFELVENDRGPAARNIRREKPV